MEFSDFLFAAFGIKVAVLLDPFTTRPTTKTN